MNSEMDHVVVVSRLGKQFQRYHANKPWTLHEALVRGLERVRPFERFWALRDVSFSVRPGRTVGLIGSNGSGKSTLLRLISGVGRPEEGSIEVHRRMNALLDLGTGFHPDLTGRENAFVNGVIGGLTRREVADRLDSIVDFAGIEPFIDNPIRTYSSGMQMRLAFAIAIHTRPEMLLIDEILSVGDRAFQKKCFDRITEFKAEGCTILFVTHDTETVRTMCDDVIWLDKGRLVAQGDPREIVDRYIAATDGEKAAGFAAIERGDNAG